MTEDCVPFFTREEMDRFFAYLDDMGHRATGIAAVAYLQGDFGIDRESAERIFEAWRTTPPPP